MATTTKTGPTSIGTTKLVRPLRGGQMTIPAEFRRALGITEDTMLRVTLADGELVVSPVEFKQSTPGEKRGSPELKALNDYFAPVREEILARGISEEEVNADIDAAIAAVRAEQRNERR
jgi:AbrB family looped-hinge helix DNA binding protein